MSPFLSCLSGSSELDRGSVELLRTYEVRFSDSESALHPGLCLGWAHWVFHAMSFRGSLSRGWGGVSFAFVPGFVAKTQGPSSLAPRFAGFTVLAQPTRDNRNGRLLYPGPLGAAHRQRCERFLFAAGCSMKELSKTAVSFWLRVPLSRVCRLSVTERSVLCPLSLVRSCCRSVSSLRRTLLSSWWEDEDVALILARLLLRGSCPSVLRSLPPVLCGGGAGPGFTRVCSPRHITTYYLETGPWAMLPRSFSYHPPPSHEMSQVVVRVCLHILKCCLCYFLEILDYISSESLVPS